MKVFNPALLSLQFPLTTSFSTTSNSFPVKGLICHCENVSVSLLEKCPHLEFFWSVFSRIRTEYGEIPHISVFSSNAGKY